MPQHYFCEWAKNRAAQPLFSNGFKKIITSKQNHDYYHKASVRIQSKKRTNFLRRRKICDRVTSVHLLVDRVPGFSIPITEWETKD